MVSLFPTVKEIQIIPLTLNLCPLSLKVTLRVNFFTHWVVCLWNQQAEEDVKAGMVTMSETWLEKIWTKHWHMGLAQIDTWSAQAGWAVELVATLYNSDSVMLLSFQHA